MIFPEQKVLFVMLIC